MRIELPEPDRFCQLMQSRYGLGDFPRIGGITIDSRMVQKGDLFIAIPGKVTDGHNHVPAAFESGAIAAMVEKEIEAPAGNFSLIKVANTIKELGHWGQIWRELHPMPLIAITGSNGKTTTKNLIISVLEQKYQVIGTASSYNSTIGLPLTLLRIGSEHEIAIIEMGTNQPGEIAYLCDLAQPNSALITNVGASHIAFLKSIEGVINEKAALFRALPKTGTAIVNLDDPAIVSMKTAARRFTYSLEKSANVSGEYKEQDSEAFLDLNDGTRIRLPLHGKYIAQNALAAVAVGSLYEVPVEKIQQGITNCPLPEGRGTRFRCNGVQVIDDTYNSNPASMIAGLETLQHLPTQGRRIVVMADMLELGSESEAYHRQVGAFAATHAVDVLYCYGLESRFAYCAAIDAGLVSFHFSDKNLLIHELRKKVTTGDTVYVKGSRGMAMETVIREVFRA